MTGRGILRSTGVAVIMVGALAGCGDSTGVATDYDPRRTLDQLDDVLYTLDGDDDFLLALDLAVLTLDWYGGAALADAVSLRPIRHRQLLETSRSTPLRSGGSPRPAGSSSFAGVDGTAALTLPWGLQGETMVWDPVDGYVPSTYGSGPSNGVRFVLYRMDPGSGYPASPLTEVGYLDLLDEDGASAERVRVRALRSTSGRTVADYTVAMTGSGSYSDGGMDVSATGTIGESSEVELDLFQRMSWNQSRDRDALDLDYQYRRGGRSIRLEGVAESAFEAPSWDLFDFEVRFRGDGPNTDVDARIDYGGSLSGEIRQDGRTAIRIRGYDGEPRFERADNRSLSWSDADTLERLWTGITDLVWFTDWILVPADLLVAAG